MRRTSCAALRTDSPALPPTSCRREIITLQLGPYANWVGAHFWNIQDESLHPALDEHGDPVHEEDDADPSVLYRAGSSRGQPTTTPRLVVCDLPDAFGTLGRRGLLYRDEADAPPAPDPLSWGGRVTTAAQERIRPNAFLQHMHGEVVAGWEELAVAPQGASAPLKFTRKVNYFKSRVYM